MHLGNPCRVNCFFMCVCVFVCVVCYAPTAIATCSEATEAVDELACCSVACTEGASNCCDSLTSGSCDGENVTYPCLVGEWGDVGVILDFSGELKER